jgi:hypothetical protein
VTGADPEEYINVASLSIPNWNHLLGWLWDLERLRKTGAAA